MLKVCTEKERCRMSALYVWIKYIVTEKAPCKIDQYKSDWIIDKNKCDWMSALNDLTIL